VRKSELDVQIRWCDLYIHEHESELLVSPHPKNAVDPDSRLIHFGSGRFGGIASAGGLASQIRTASPALAK